MTWFVYDVRSIIVQPTCQQFSNFLGHSGTKGCLFCAKVMYHRIYQLKI